MESTETRTLAGPSTQVDQGLPSSCIKLSIASFMRIWGLDHTKAEKGLWARVFQKGQAQCACALGNIGANWQRLGAVTD